MVTPERFELAAHVIARGGAIPQHALLLEEAATQLRQLADACQLFTQSFGKGGYLPEIGSLKTEKALALMREAGVEPKYFQP